MIFLQATSGHSLPATDRSPARCGLASRTPYMAALCGDARRALPASIQAPVRRGLNAFASERACRGFGLGLFARLVVLSACSSSLPTLLRSLAEFELSTGSVGNVRNLVGGIRKIVGGCHV